MEKSKVYYTSMKVNSGTNLLKKLDHLVREAGIANIDFENKYTAIKIHFGEPGNLAFLRPNYAKVIVDLVKELGGKPFLTDCNTLYVGRRKNALDHLDAAYENGFSPFSTGCHVIIADGLKGTDETLVPVNGEYIKEAKIGHAVMDADIIISLNHFKGHESTGFGGAFKNLGMGCGSRAGKMEMHSSGKPVVNQALCISCGECRKNCAHDAISFVDYNGENKPGSRAERKNAKKRAIIDHNKCVGCGRCIGACPEDAVKAGQDEANTVLNYKIAEYTYAVIHGRPNFHISLVIDVSLIATATRKTISRLSPTSACSLPLTRSLWIRPAQMQSTVSRWSAATSSPKRSTATTTISPTRTRTPTGKAACNTPLKWEWAAGNMS